MKKNKFAALVLLMLMLVISTAPMVCAGKSFYWLVTDGVIDSQIVFVEHSDYWTGEGLEEQIAQFQWYVDRGTSRGGSLIGLDKPVSGTKATLSMISSGNDLQLTIELIKGRIKNPSAGPETYKWIIFNGKDSTNDCINVVFTNLDNGKILTPLSLYENDIAYISLPNVLKFECRMWLT